MAEERLFSGGDKKGDFAFPQSAKPKIKELLDIFL